MSGAIEYNTDLFDAATIKRMLSHYEQILRSMVHDLDQAVSELPLLTAGEQQQFLDWNPTDVVYPVSGSLHEILQRRQRAHLVLSPSCLKTSD